MERSDSSRNNNIDLIRIISMVLVVGSHLIIKPFSNLPIASNALFKIFCSANCAFFMISGYNNLGVPFSTATDIKRFYARRAVSILLPYLVMSVALFIWSDIYSTGSFSIATFPVSFYKVFMGENFASYCWFMYYLIGLIISTPILARAFSSMSDAELIVIFIVGLIWITFSSYLTAAFGIKFEYKGWVLNSWAFAYYSGYLIRRVGNMINSKKLYIIGFFSFVLRVVAITYFPKNWHFSDESSILYFLSSIAAFVFALNHFNIRRSSTIKAVEKVSSISFYVYLVHPAVITELSPLIRKVMEKVNHASIVFCIYYVLTLFFSFVIAFVLHYWVFSPVQKKLYKRISEKYPTVRY